MTTREFETGPDGRPIARHNLKPHDFPMRIYLFDEQTGEQLWHEVVEAPRAVEVPGFAPRVVRVEVITGHGLVTKTASDGTTTMEFLPVLGCALVPEELSVDRRRLWDLITADLDEDAAVLRKVYPGSIKGTCSQCSVGVWIGPRQQQEQQAAGLDRIIILCMLCAGQLLRTRRGNRYGGQPSARRRGVESVNLGNPWEKA